MADNLTTLREHVHFLQEREGVRQVRLTKAARQGLARLAAENKSQAGSRARESVAATPPPYGGGYKEPVAPQSAVTLPSAPAETVARRSTATFEPPLEITGSNKVEQLRHLAERASACVKCPHLVARRHNVVFGVGDPDAKLMFVGEAPGQDEDLKGEPFVGPAGQLLTKMILAMGVTREQVYIGNIVKCRPDMPLGAPGNRKPTKQEMETCVPYLRAQIDVIRPTVLVALGATAVEGLVGSAGTIGSLRGKFLEYRGVPLMPTYHPSYLLRNQSNTEKRKVWEDLLKVMERLEMPISEKQRNYFLKT
jgi:DNA polymerase